MGVLQHPWHMPTTLAARPSHIPLSRLTDPEHLNVTRNVKSAVTRSLLDHGRAGSFAFPPPIGSLLDVELATASPADHLDVGVPPDWSGGRIPVRVRLF